MSAMGFKGRVDSVCAFLLVWSSDSPQMQHLSVADPGFPRGGSANPKGGGANLLFGQFFPKTA